MAQFLAKGRSVLALSILVLLDVTLGSCDKPATRTSSASSGVQEQVSSAPEPETEVASAKLPRADESAASKRETEKKKTPREASGSGAQMAQSGPRILELPLSDHEPLVVWLPRRSGPHPVVMSAHGAGGRAEDHCAYWWKLFAGSRVIACLRGRPLFRTEPARGYYYPDHHELASEVGAAISALSHEFGTRLSSGWTYAGYSQGATMGALMILSYVPHFQRFIFVEGGAQAWTWARSRRLREGGSPRVLFACGRESCSDDARRAVQILEKVGVAAQLREAYGAGHTYLGGVARTVEKGLPWLIGRIPGK